MANIWKIGAWPGFPGDKNNPKNKKRFIEDFALPNNFVAIGWEKCSIQKCRSIDKCRRCNLDYSSRGCKEFKNFSTGIIENDIVLLYNYGKVYVGEVCKRSNGSVYYKDKYKPRNRINVKWLNKEPRQANFHHWRDTVHQVLKKDLAKISDNDLKSFLEKKFNLPNEDEIEQEELEKYVQGKSKKEIITQLNALKESDPEVVKYKNTKYKRDNKTIADLKKIRDFKCQICGKYILMKNGRHYIEAAHIKPKQEKGCELPRNILILCPNHHKEFDFGNKKIKAHSKNRLIFLLNKEEHRINLKLE
jgi:Predicted restriction endonuclease